MTAISTRGLIWPPKQVWGLYRRKPHLKTGLGPARANWGDYQRQYAGDAMRAAMENFKHVSEPPGQDEWGAEKETRIRSSFTKTYRTIFEGDCDDAVPMIMAELVKRGFSLAQMRLLIGESQQGWHMVLGLEVTDGGEDDSIIFDHRHEGFWSYGEGPTHPEGDLKLRAASVPGAFFWTHIVN